MKKYFEISKKHLIEQMETFSTTMKPKKIRHKSEKKTLNESELSDIIKRILSKEQ